VILLSKAASKILPLMQENQAADHLISAFSRTNLALLGVALALILAASRENCLRR